MSRTEDQAHTATIELSALLKSMEDADARALGGSDYAKVRVSVDFASAQVFRGSTSDQFAIQPGLEVWGLGLPQRYGFINVGAWGSMAVDDNEGTSGEFEFSEIDWYGTYILPEILVDDLYLFIGYIEYTYPGVDIPANKEINAGIEYWIANLVLGSTAYFGVGGETLGDDYYDIAASYFFVYSPAVSASLDALAGYFDPDAGTSGWNEGVVGFSVDFALGDVWSVGGTLSYIVQLDDSVQADFQQDEPVDDYLFGMLSFSAVY
jgi:hypothetical protein